MSTKANIQEWLQADEPDYDQGLTLLRPHCSNRGLLTSLNKKDNKFNRQKLRYELGKVVAGLPDEPAEPTGAGAGDQEPTGTDLGAGDLADQPVINGFGEENTSPSAPGEAVTGTTETAAGNGANGVQLPGSGLPPTDQAYGGLNIDAVWMDEAGPDGQPKPDLAGFPLGVITDTQGGPQVLPGELFINSAGEPVGASTEVQEALKMARERLAQESGRSPQEQAQEVITALDKLTIEGSQVYVEKARLSNSLRELATDEERKKVIDNIVTLEGKLQEINSQKEYIIQNNRLPDQPAPADQAPVDKAQLTRDRNNLRSQVSKARGALSKTPKDLNKQEKLAKLEAELEEVENILKTLDA